jgi:hypothetical protein
MKLRVECISLSTSLCYPCSAIELGRQETKKEWLRKILEALLRPLNGNNCECCTTKDTTSMRIVRDSLIPFLIIGVSHSDHGSSNSIVACKSIFTVLLMHSSLLLINTIPIFSICLPYRLQATPPPLCPSHSSYPKGLSRSSDRYSLSLIRQQCSLDPRSS